jgi:hypothetical protein
MSTSNSRYVLIQWALPFLLGVFWVIQAGGIAQASAVNAANTAFVYQQGQSFHPNLLLAKNSFPSTHGNAAVGDISVGGGGNKPVQPKSPPPKQPSNPKSTNYNEVLPGFTQLPNLLPK